MEVMLGRGRSTEGGLGLGKSKMERFIPLAI